MRNSIAKLLPSFSAVPIAALVVTGCIATGGNTWVEGNARGSRTKSRDQGWMVETRAPESAAQPASADEPPVIDDRPELVHVQDFGDGVPRALVAAGDALFRNTYYDFPSEGDGAKAATIYDAACVPLAKVTRDFHDRVCVQGSGKLAGGGTVSYARRDCECADVCPRTGQKICFERLDAGRFPHGRGATGKAIAPMRTVAVDSTVIPLGTPLFIPEFVGVARPDGTLHDGCFLAEDRGLKVVGKQIDVFTGDPSTTARLNAIVPSNLGVHVALNDARCRGSR